MARMKSLYPSAVAALAAVMSSTAMAEAPFAPLPPSVPGIDTPQLAALGPDKVGFRRLQLVNKAQPDLLAADPKTGVVPLHNRKLVVDIWYPAKVRARAAQVTYRASLWGETPRPPVSFSQAGIAVRNATPVGRKHPMVIVSHGYSNAPAVMTWLTENLASKGYVVAAIHHEDPNPYTVSEDRRAAPNYNRPRDIAFVAAQLRAALGTQVDPERVALIGYSQGGYGVLTAGGARLDPDGPNMALVAGGWLKTIAQGTAGAAQITVPGIKAIVALAPGGGGERSAWGKNGLAGITAPLLLIAGDADPVVGYDHAAKAFFASTVGTDRYLLTYRTAGHSIALNPVPREMRGSLWDIDWFEDPIWRQDRINAINLHFITAFLAFNLRGERDKLAYLDVPVETSDDGAWDAPAGTPWGAYSPGGTGVTLWKGFQRRHAQGMLLRHAAAGE
ncbi:MAG: dienelactone hydrolase [Novosphingobium sp.]|nr:dienelactone hydrolase [Novosphingobium sp.]